MDHAIAVAQQGVSQEAGTNSHEVNVSTAQCSVSECTKPRRAKGLCSTHYNQAHQQGRHAGIQRACEWCGKTVLKPKSTSAKRRVTCSAQCRTNIQFPPKSELPKDHWARWFGKTSAWPKRPIIQCAGCGEDFIPNTDTAQCCSRRCRKTKLIVDAGGATEQQMLSVTRICHTCGTAYTSPYLAQTTCTSCRTQYGKGKWIGATRRRTLYERDDYMCHLCGERTNPDAHYLDWDYPTLDHLTPRSLGGSHEDSNLSTSHRACNTRRGAKALDTPAAG